MLLMKRADTGEWSIPAGHLEPNEEPLRAAQREAAEETGWPGNHRAYKVHEKVTRGVRFHTFVQPSEWQFKPILNPEHTQHGWYRMSRLPSPLHPGLVATLHYMSEGGQKPPS
jgi:8-oxo-dGTP pyrophosphatase MutT (NUDIX family)